MSALPWGSREVHPTLLQSSVSQFHRPLGSRCAAPCCTMLHYAAPCRPCAPAQLQIVLCGQNQAPNLQLSMASTQVEPTSVITTPMWQAKTLGFPTSGRKQNLCSSKNHSPRGFPRPCTTSVLLAPHAPGTCRNNTPPVCTIHTLPKAKYIQARQNLKWQIVEVFAKDCNPMQSFYEPAE